MNNVHYCFGYLDAVGNLAYMITQHGVLDAVRMSLELVEPTNKNREPALKAVKELVVKMLEE